MIRLNSIRELATSLRCSPSTVRRLIARGDLPVIRIGRRLIRIQETDIDLFLRRSANHEGRTD
jgi:excisionase family DNA binding protein